MLTSTFIKKIVPYAQKTQREFQIFACITIAQAILESAWGKSKLTKKKKSVWNESRYFMEWRNPL